MSFKKHKIYYTHSIKDMNGGVCENGDTDNNKLIISGLFDNNTKIYHIKQHTVKHLDEMNIHCDNINALDFLVKKALTHGVTSIENGSISAIDAFNIAINRLAFKIINLRSNQMDYYCIVGNWDYWRNLFTIFTICNCDRNGNCIYPDVNVYETMQKRFYERD